MYAFFPILSQFWVSENPVRRREAVVDKPEVIVSIAAEGGSLTLFGRKDAKNAWKFSRGVNDQTPTLLEENDGGGQAVDHVSGWVSTWPDAVALLDRYPWAMLGGKEVHPEFRALVWTAVTQRLHDIGGSKANRAKARWARACGVSNGDD